jgi:hypothetical protein
MKLTRPGFQLSSILARIVLSSLAARRWHDVGDGRWSAAKCRLVSHKEDTMINKPKSGKAQSKSNGRANRHAISDGPPKAPVPDHERAVEKFRGTLQDFNFSPRGGVEGFLLHSDGQTVQVNVSVDVGFAVVRGIGQNVEATVEPDSDGVKHDKGDHPVYKLVTLTGTDGKALIFSGTIDAELVTGQGIVKRINYARNGAANGVILDSGDFIYLKPAGMKRAGLKVGDRVSAEGTASLMPLGQQVIEAKTVNGVAVTSTKAVQSARRSRS